LRGAKQSDGVMPIEWEIRLVRSSSDLRGGNLPTAAMRKAS
jgi:hypothetical protein